MNPSIWSYLCIDDRSASFYNAYSSVIPLLRINEETQMPESRGTSFAFEFNIDGNRIPCLVTNRHVLGDGTIHSMLFRTSSPDSPEEIEYRMLRLSSPDAILFHPDPSIDLAIIGLGQVLTHFFAKTGRLLAHSIIPEELIFDNSDIDSLSIGSRAFLIGYPRSISGPESPFILAAPIEVTHYLTRAGVDALRIGAPVRHGSSGSPVFIAPQQYFSKEKPELIYTAQDIRFIGVCYAGEFDSQPIEDEPANHALAIRASRLLDFKPLIRTRLLSEDRYWWDSQI